MLWQVLTSIGFKEKESKVYLALLELGEQPSSTIAKKTGINRTTCYLILMDLMRRGLVSSFEKGKINYFTAANPETILTHIQAEKKNLEKQENFFKTNLETLLELTESKNIKPRVQFFEGFEGIKTVYNDTLKNKNKILGFGDIQNYPERLKEFIYNEYIPLRIKKKISFYGIVPSTEATSSRVKEDKKFKRATQKIPIELPLNIRLNIYGNKVAFMSHTDEKYSGVIIEDKLIHQAMSTIHRLAWMHCETKSRNRGLFKRRGTS